MKKRVLTMLIMASVLTSSTVVYAGDSSVENESYMPTWMQPNDAVQY